MDWILASNWCSEYLRSWIADAVADKWCKLIYSPDLHPTYPLQKHCKTVFSITLLSMCQRLSRWPAPFGLKFETRGLMQPWLKLGWSRFANVTVTMLMNSLVFPCPQDPRQAWALELSNFRFNIISINRTTIDIHTRPRHDSSAISEWRLVCLFPWMSHVKAQLLSTF